MTLGADESVFWVGDWIESGSPTFQYKVRLVDQAAALRVGIDVPSRTDMFKITLIDPVGKAAAVGYKNYGYATELHVPSPSLGTWTISVKARGVGDAIFRLRARLESRRQGRSTGQPDLRSIPPFDFTFSAPDDGSASDFENDSDDLTPPPPQSCAVDETTEQRAMRCLRFSAGIENAGIGPLDLRFDTQDPQERIVQYVHRRDGSVRSRPAGSFHYHDTHNHFHYQEAWTFTLLRVTDPEAGRMEKVGTTLKAGFCPADQRLARWHSFSNAPPYSLPSDCGMRYEESDEGFELQPKKGLGRMAFAAGWGDVYGWYRPGNYVEFGLELGGQYVVRAVVDPKNHIQEQREGNNFGYALIDVSGGKIELIERGRGRSPWDPNRTLIYDWWRGPG